MANCEIWRRMPKDLRDVIKDSDDILIKEKPPAPAITEEISHENIQLKVYYPLTPRAKNVVVIHFPGGMPGSSSDLDNI